MTTDEKKPYDLASIEPLAPVPDAEDAREQRDRADRVGFAAAASAGTPPAVGVAAERADEPIPDSTDEPRPQPR
jgi:hypothetical protein